MSPRDRVVALARREWTEQRRQPWMVAAITALMAIVAATGPVVAVTIQLVLAIAPDTFAVAFPGASPESVVGAAVTSSLFLGFTQYLGIAAVMAGHGILHDRQCGTFTFLLLAPISRRQLLVGKIAGALALPTLVYWVTTGGAALLSFAVPLARAASPEALPGAPAFWAALLLGGPAWSAFAGAVCAGISALSSDVRTAQQGSWFVVFFAALLAGTVLVWALPLGLLAELGVAAVAVAGAALAIEVGAELLARDLAR